MMNGVWKLPMKAGDRIPVRAVRREEGSSVTFDFGATYPLGDVRGMEFRGVVRVEHSLNGKDWTTAADGGSSDGGESFMLDNVLAHYVRLSGGEGLEQAAEFRAGRGLAAEPADEWTGLFHRNSGWTGSDGIYSIPFNGVEARGSADGTKTLFLFGDTFIGGVDPVTGGRVDFSMINNSMAVLEGGQPDAGKLSFHWETSGKTPGSSIIPRTPKGLSEEGTYYWLQDGTSVGGRFYCFPMIIGPNPEGPEGFQFKVHGVTRVSAPFGSDGPLLGRQEQIDTPLYYEAANGKITYFGAAVMPNTAEAGVPAPDGFIYIYGLQNHDKVKLVAARVEAERFEDISAWTYWDGAGWSRVKENAVPVAEETSCEVSVSPMSGGMLDGKYVVAFQQDMRDPRISLYVGDSPVGPFSGSIPLYYCREPEEGNSIYVYNAKAHPHLSRPGELLISYNVNTTSWEAHERDASIYRPRFLRVRELT